MISILITRSTSLAPPRSSRRALSRVSSFTLNSPSPSALFTHLRSRLASLPSRSSIILYSLSSTIPSPSLPSFLSLLRRSASHSIGLLSSPIFSSSAPSHTVSVALLHDTQNFTLFRSEAKGREAVSVGRWRPMDPPRSLTTSENGVNDAMKTGDWSNIWSGSSDKKVAQSCPAEPKADIRMGFKGLENVESTRINALVVFTTPTAAPAILRDLHELSPFSQRIGVIAPPTSFVNGRPFTLFLDGAVLEEGSVGVALLQASSSLPPSLKLSVDWEGMEQLGEFACEVTAAQGNLLLGLNILPDPSSPPTDSSSQSTLTSNPTQHLISLLSASSSPDLKNASVGSAWLGGKDKDFFVGFLGGEGGVGGVIRVIRILSGDPKRGGMALDCEESVRVGERFIFLHRPSSSSKLRSSTSRQPSSPSPRTSNLAFDFATVAEPPLTSSAAPSNLDAVVHVEEGVFRAGSERGWLWGEAGQLGFVDGGVPGGAARLVIR